MSRRMSDTSQVKWLTGLEDGMSETFLELKTQELDETIRLMRQGFCRMEEQQAAWEDRQEEQQ